MYYDTLVVEEERERFGREGHHELCPSRTHTVSLTTVPEPSDGPMFRVVVVNEVDSVIRLKD